MRSHLLVFPLAVLLLAAPLYGQKSADDRFIEFTEKVWQARLQDDPLMATRAGVNKYNDRLPDESLANQKKRHQQNLAWRKELQQFDRKKLSRKQQTNYAIFARLLNDSISESEFETYLIPITNRWGFHIAFPTLAKRTPFKTVKDYEDYIARLKAFRNYAGQHIKLMRLGIEKGMVLPSVVLKQYREPIETHIVQNPTKSLLYQPFLKFHESISAGDQKRLQAAGQAAIREGVVPGYQDFLQFMEKEYVPAARGSLGASALPRGRDYYRFVTRKFTTLDITPEEVHARGMSEVKRIRQEMAKVIQKTGFEGDFAGFVKHLRTDPKFYPKTAEELMKEVAYILKKMDGELPKLFKTLPRTPYGIRKVPDYIAPQTTAAYYMSPPGDGSKGGFYYVNTYNLKSRPLYNLEALSLHEAVPGHHLQLALQQELELPNFRRFASFTVFVEGWALYSERLGLEVGFYQDPYSDFGRLTYEMWRALRLVVDTGIHYMGWTRQQAIDFMAENSALSIHNIQAEVDRYISWPGQALGYKIGELKIRELRKEAEQRLGERFDVREFHEVVLGGGSMPLAILEENVKRYIERERAAK